MLTRIANPSPDHAFEHPVGVDGFSLSPDGKRLATACDDGWVRIWDYENGDLLERLGSHESEVQSIAYSPDGKLLVCGCRSGRLMIWEASADNRFASRKLYEEEEGLAGIESIEWSPDGSVFAAAYRYEYVRVMNPDGMEIFRTKQEADIARFESVLFSADGTLLYVPNQETTMIEAWDMNGTLVK